MKYTIKGTNIQLTKDLTMYIEKKMDVLDKFAAHFGPSIAAQVEVGRTSRHHRTGDVFRVEVQVHVPGKELRAEATKKSVFEAMDAVKDEIQKELERRKDKEVDAKRRGGAHLKKILRE